MAKPSQCIPWAQRVHSHVGEESTATILAEAGIELFRHRFNVMAVRLASAAPSYKNVSFTVVSTFMVWSVCFQSQENSLGSTVTSLIHRK